MVTALLEQSAFLGELERGKNINVLACVKFLFQADACDERPSYSCPFSFQAYCTVGRRHIRDAQVKVK